MVRLNIDGSLDTGFGGGGLFESIVATRATDVAVQPGDDKIVVTAIAPRVGGGPDPNRFTTVRILADGEGLDPAFDGDGVVQHRYGDDGLGGYCYANAVAVQRDGKIVVGASPTSTISSTSPTTSSSPATTPTARPTRRSGPVPPASR